MCLDNKFNSTGFFEIFVDVGPCGNWTCFSWKASGFGHSRLHIPRSFFPRSLILFHYINCALPHLFLHSSSFSFTSFSIYPSDPLKILTYLKFKSNHLHQTATVQSPRHTIRKVLEYSIWISKATLITSPFVVITLPSQPTNIRIALHRCLRVFVVLCWILVILTR